jgi:hypothetical protein
MMTGRPGCQMASTPSSLVEPPGADCEAAIVKQFWAKDIPPSKAEAYRPYFRYYATECRRLRLGISKESWQSSTMVATTHEHILLIVNKFPLEKDLFRPNLRSSLRRHFPNGDDIAINRSIDFALRVWITMNVREECYGLQTPRTPTIQWNDTSSLVDFIARNFPQATTTASSLQLDHTFTAANINRLSGIDIEWTPCLADHLRFDKRRRLLRIYPFKQVLLDHLQLWEGTESQKGSGLVIASMTRQELLTKVSNRSILPKTLLKETLLSLNLLFPHWDTLTDSFMLQHDQTFHLEGPFGDNRPSNLANFNHWRNRLLELHQIFHSPPVGWTQIWADRRNPLQWYTFWIAIVILVLTIIFGIISSVTAIIQTWLAYESVRIVRSQIMSSPG